MTARVVFLDRASLKARVRKPAFAAEYIEHEKTAVGEIVPRLAGATVAIINKVPMRADTLRQLPDLKMIAVAATGYDVVDVAYCKEHGIAVANIRNYAVHTVPEHAFAMILALRRNLLAYRQDVENGVWNKSDQFCFFTHDIGDLHGATLGIIGEGAIGQGTAAIGRAFGMHVLFAEGYADRDYLARYTDDPAGLEAHLAVRDPPALHITSSIHLPRHTRTGRSRSDQNAYKVDGPSTL